MINFINKRKGACHSLIFFIWFFAGCNERSSSEVTVDKSELSAFFETKDINLELYENTLQLVVENSELLESKSKESEQSKREFLELYSSLGALILATNLDSNVVQCDSISVWAKSSIGEAKYVYNYRYLLDVRRNVEVSRNFLQSLKLNDYQSSQSYLSKAIKKDIPETIFFEPFKKAFPYGEIKDATLAGFLFDIDMVSLYMTVDFGNDVQQTYVFTFLLNEDVISGIQTPQ